MLDPARLSRLDDPVLLDTVSTVLTGFVGIWDDPTRQALDRLADETVTRAKLQDEVVYLRGFTIVFVLGRELGDGRLKTALLDRFYGRAWAIIPDAEGFLARAEEYTAAIDAAGPDELGAHVGPVFAGRLDQQGNRALAGLGASQFAALEGVLTRFLHEATASLA